MILFAASYVILIFFPLYFKYSKVLLILKKLITDFKSLYFFPVLIYSLYFDDKKDNRYSV